MAQHTINLDDKYEEALQAFLNGGGTLEQVVQSVLQSEYQKEQTEMGMKIADAFAKADDATQKSVTDALKVDADFNAVKAVQAESVAEDIAV